MIAVIDYEAGNLTSVARALSHIAYKCIITNNHKDLLMAERIIFPGVGAAGSAMASLKRLGLDNAIKDALAMGKPILGICLGTQIIMQYSLENEVACLGIIAGKVLALPNDICAEDGSRLKIPHMGWNRFNLRSRHPVLAGLRRDYEFYFVHSFYPEPYDSEHVIGTTDYGIRFPSIIGFKNIIATQFHPEKSGRPGLEILKNFCEWQPC